MTPFTFNTTGSLQFGAGKVAALGDLARARIGRRVMLVTDPGMVATGLVARATA